MAVMIAPSLRDYQVQLNDLTFAELATHKRVAVQLATGGGKTECAIALLEEFLKRNRKVIWMTDRQELRRQSGSRLNRYAIPVNDLVEAYTYQRYILPGFVNVISPGIRSFDHLWDACDAGDLLVVDEFHHAVARSWQRKIESFPGFVVGYSATPARSNAQEGFEKLFDALVQTISIPELIDENWLSPFQIFMPRENRRIRGGRVLAGDYDPDDVMHVNRTEVYMDLAMDYWKEVVEKNREGARTLVYCLNRAHSLNFAKMLADQGYTVGCVMSEIVAPRNKDDKVALYERQLSNYEDLYTAWEEAERAGVELDRETAFDNFRSGDLQFLVNVNVVSEGADIPELDCVLITRPTKSPTLFLQMVGRALRPTEEKEVAYILDLCANSDRLGRPLFDPTFRWNLRPRVYGEEDLGGEGVPKEPCPGCGACYFPIPRHPHYCKFCGYSFGRICIAGCGEFRWTHDWFSPEAPHCNHCIRAAQKHRGAQESESDLVEKMDVRSSEESVGFDMVWRRSKGRTANFVVEFQELRFVVCRARGGWRAGYIKIQPNDNGEKQAFRYSDSTFPTREDAIKYAEAFIHNVENIRYVAEEAARRKKEFEENMEEQF